MLIPSTAQVSQPPTLHQLKPLPLHQVVTFLMSHLLLHQEDQRLLLTQLTILQVATLLTLSQSPPHPEQLDQALLKLHLIAESRLSGLPAPQLVDQVELKPPTFQALARPSMKLAPMPQDKLALLPNTSTPPPADHPTPPSRDPPLEALPRLSHPPLPHLDLHLLTPQ